MWAPNALNVDWMKLDHHPVGVGGAEIGGIAAQRIANLGQQRLLANQRAAARGVRLGKQFSDGYARLRRIGDEVVYVGEGQLHRLELPMEAFHGVAGKSGSIRSLRGY